MKFLITGGNRGLGKTLKEFFKADSMSRQENAVDITQHADLIAESSLSYDVFINNAFDGPPQESWANFAQTILLIKTYDKWKENNKNGFIFNIGSIASESIVAPDPSWETYRTSKKALEHASLQCSKAFRDDIVAFKTTLIKPDRLDTELSRSRQNWTGNGVNCKDIADFINYAVNLQKNTQIDSVTISVNYEHKKEK